MKKLDVVVLTAIVAATVLGAAVIMSPQPVIADKNAQAECINEQNKGFVGKEQSGDAYKHSKDTCQGLS